MRKMQLNEVIQRWKKTSRSLKPGELESGRYLIDVLERRTDADLVNFTDPVEAAVFFCLLELVTKAGVYGATAGEIPASLRNSR